MAAGSTPPSPSKTSSRGATAAPTQCASPSRSPRPPPLCPAEAPRADEALGRSDAGAAGAGSLSRSPRAGAGRPAAAPPSHRRPHLPPTPPMLGDSTPARRRGGGGGTVSHRREATGATAASAQCDLVESAASLDGARPVSGSKRRAAVARWVDVAVAPSLRDGEAHWAGVAVAPSLRDGEAHWVGVAVAPSLRDGEARWAGLAVAPSLRAGEARWVGVAVALGASASASAQRAVVAPRRKRTPAITPSAVRPPLSAGATSSESPTKACTMGVKPHSART